MKWKMLRPGSLLTASANLKADGVHLHTLHPETLHSTGQTSWWSALLSWSFMWWATFKSLVYAVVLEVYGRTTAHSYLSTLLSWSCVGKRERAEALSHMVHLSLCAATSLSQSTKLHACERTLHKLQKSKMKHPNTYRRVGPLDAPQRGIHKSSRGFIQHTSLSLLAKLAQRQLLPRCHSDIIQFCFWSHHRRPLAAATQHSLLLMRMSQKQVEKSHSPQADFNWSSSKIILCPPTSGEGVWEIFSLRKDYKPKKACFWYVPLPFRAVHLWFPRKKKEGEINNSPPPSWEYEISPII